MTAGPSVGPVVGSTDYDDVVQLGAGYIIVPGVTAVCVRPGRFFIRPKAYWPVKFYNLVASVLSMAAKEDQNTWAEHASGAGDGTLPDLDEDVDAEADDKYDDNGNDDDDGDEDYVCETESEMEKSD